MKVYAQLITDACKQVGLLLCALESGAECPPPPTAPGAAGFVLVPYSERCPRETGQLRLLLEFALTWG